MAAQYNTSYKPVSSLTICPAVVTKAFTYKNSDGADVSVPLNERVYVDRAAGVALIGRDHVDIGEDEYRCLDN